MDGRGSRSAPPDEGPKVKPLPDPTPEQLEILVSVQLNPVTLVEAGPGCAKSTTIRLSVAANPVPNRTSTYIFAFNKDIVDDLKSSIPYGVTVQTLNSFGLSLWRKHIGRMPTLDTKKSRRLLKQLADASNRWSILPDEIDPLLSLLRFAKSQGYTPPGAPKVPGAPGFAELCALVDIRPEKHYETLLVALLNMTIGEAFEGTIDFDDQIYVTALFAPAEAFPKISYLFVDEAQDLSPIQLRLVGRCKADHLCVVGDPLQAIYAFRGAMSDAFERIHAYWPDAKVLPLQTSYRLPQSVLPELQGHNPRLTSAKAEAGLCHTNSEIRPLAAHVDWYKPFPTARAAMLCRNNAPLYRAALACIASSQPFNIRDNGWGYSLLKDLRKACGKRMLVSEVPEIMATYWYFEGMSQAQEDALIDKISTLVACGEGLETSGELADRLEGLLAKTNDSDAAHPLHLSTVHKAKGMEWELVFHLDPHLIPSPLAKTPDELQQEANIAYVLNSRTLHTLVFISSQQILIPSHPGQRQRPSSRERQRL